MSALSIKFSKLIASSVQFRLLFLFSILQMAGYSSMVYQLNALPETGTTHFADVLCFSSNMGEHMLFQQGRLCEAMIANFTFVRANIIVHPENSD